MLCSRRGLLAVPPSVAKQPRGCVFTPKRFAADKWGRLEKCCPSEGFFCAEQEPSECFGRTEARSEDRPFVRTPLRQGRCFDGVDGVRSRRSAYSHKHIKVRSPT